MYHYNYYYLLRRLALALSICRFVCFVTYGCISVCISRFLLGSVGGALRTFDYTRSRSLYFDTSF